MMFDISRFGDRFKTRIGELAIYCGKKMGGYHVLMTKNATFLVDSEGRIKSCMEDNNDIVGFYD